MMNYLHRYFLTLILCPCLLFWNVAFAKNDKQQEIKDKVAESIDLATVTAGEVQGSKALDTDPLMGETAEAYNNFITSFFNETIPRIEALEAGFIAALEKQIAYQKEFDKSIGIDKSDAAYSSSIRGLTDALNGKMASTAAAQQAVNDANALLSDAEKQFPSGSGNKYMQQAMAEVTAANQGTDGIPMATNSSDNGQAISLEDISGKMNQCLKEKCGCPESCLSDASYAQLEDKSVCDVCNFAEGGTCEKCASKDRSARNAAINKMCQGSDYQGGANQGIKTDTSKGKKTSRSKKSVADGMKGLCGASGTNPQLQAVSDYAGGVNDGDKGQREGAVRSMDELYAAMMKLNQGLNARADEAAGAADSVFNKALDLINEFGGQLPGSEDNSKNIKLTRTLQECVTARTTQDECEKQLNLLLGTPSSSLSADNSKTTGEGNTYLESTIDVAALSTAAIYDDYFSCRKYNYNDVPSLNGKPNGNQDFVDSISYHLFRAANAIYVAKRIVYAAVFNRIGEELKKMDFNYEEKEKLCEDQAKAENICGCVYDEQVCHIEKALFLEKITALLLTTQEDAQASLLYMIGQVYDVAVMEHESAKARQNAAFTLEKHSKTDMLLIIAIIGMVVGAVTMAAIGLGIAEAIAGETCSNPFSASACPGALAVFIAAGVVFAAMTGLLIYQLLNQKDSTERNRKMTQEKIYAAVHMALICNYPKVVEYKDFIKQKPQTDEQSKDSNSGKNNEPTATATPSGVKIKIAGSKDTSSANIASGKGLTADDKTEAAAQMMLQESKEFQKYWERRNHHAQWMGSKYRDEASGNDKFYEELPLKYDQDSSSDEDDAILWMHHNFCISGQDIEKQKSLYNNPKNCPSNLGNNQTMGIWCSCKETDYKETENERRGTYIINDGFELPKGRVNYLEKLLTSIGDTLGAGAGTLHETVDRLNKYNELLTMAQDQMKKKQVPDSGRSGSKDQTVKKVNRDNGTELKGNDLSVGASGLGVSSNSIKSPNDLVAANLNSLKSGGELDPASLSGQQAAGKNKANGILKSLLEKLKKLKEQNAQRNAKKNKSNALSSGKSKSLSGRGQMGNGSFASSEVGLKDPEILNDGQSSGRGKGQEEDKANASSSSRGQGDSAWQSFLNKYGNNGKGSGSGNSSYNNSNSKQDTANGGDASGLSDEEKEEIAEGLSKQKGLEVGEGDSLWTIITKTYQKRAYPTLLKLKPAKARR